MLLEVRNLTKRFFGVTVLNGVNLRFLPGEVHAVLGENGAGKSTLIKIIGGAYRADGGDVCVDGNPVRIASTLDAVSLGISVVYQEYNLVKNLTVLDNVLLGKERSGRFGYMDRKQSRKTVEDLARKDNIKVDLDKYAGDLGSAEAKVAEILRACSNDMKILILDEPTAALDDEDVAALFGLIRTLTARGVGVVYISHRLDEVFRICDTVSVLKDGNYVGTWDARSIDRNFLVNAMVGREISDVFPERGPEILPEARVALSVREITDGQRFFDVSFDVREGEILGIGGMSGHGQREMIRSLFGVGRRTGGEIRIDGKAVNIRSPSAAMGYGMAFLSDDRRNEGLALEQSVARNIAYPSLAARAHLGVIDSRAQEELVERLVARLNIKLASGRQTVQGLSGGNQQRVVLAKWLPLNPKIMLFHEPTLGIDIGAKAEIYRIFRDLAKEGISIVMVTSDMMELLSMSDRIGVFYEGRMAAMYPGRGATEEMVMAAASGNPPAPGGGR